MGAHTHDDYFLSHTRQLDDHERRITDLEGFDVEMKQTLKSTNEQLQSVTNALNLLTGKFEVVLKIVYALTGISVLAVLGTIIEQVITRLGG
jgi:hypothetical protein